MTPSGTQTLLCRQSPDTLLTDPAHPAKQRIYYFTQKGAKPTLYKTYSAKKYVT